jgi:primosomal protein N'
MRAAKGGGNANSVMCPAVPEFLTCPTCGLEMGLWFDEEETRCLFCGHRFFRRESTVH